MYTSSINILLVIFAFEITTSASLATSPPLRPLSISREFDMLQPRNIVLNTITPPIQNIVNYLMKSLSLFSDIFAEVFAIPANPLLPKNTAARVSTNSIPVQNFKRDIIVEGSNGNILIDGKPKYYNDGEFKNGRVRVQIRDGNFYVNDNLVAKKDSKKVKSIFYSIHDLGYSEVTHFELKIYANGFMEYADSAHHKYYVNYMTWINFR